MATTLNAEAARSLGYFHDERGDMTRMTVWPELKPQIKQRFPEVIDAMERLESAQRTLDIVVKNMVNTLEGEEPHDPPY